VDLPGRSRREYSFIIGKFPLFQMRILLGGEEGRLSASTGDREPLSSSATTGDRGRRTEDREFPDDGHSERPRAESREQPTRRRGNLARLHCFGN